MQIFGLNSFGFNASRPEVKMIAFDSDLSNPFFVPTFSIKSDVV